MAATGRRIAQSPSWRQGSKYWREYWLWGLLLSLLLGCAEENTGPGLEPPGQAPDQVLWDFTTTDSDSGKLTWILRADRALVFQKAKRVESEGIRVDMYGDDRQLNSTLTADSGRFDRRSGSMTAHGNVKVVSREGYELVTEILHWDRERELFHTEAYVEVRQGENLSSGYEMECDQHLDRLEIKREPKGVIVQKEAEENG